MVFDLLGCLSPPDVMNQRFGYLGSEKTSPVGSDENIYSSHSTSRSNPDAGNPCGPQSHLVCKAHWIVSGLYEGSLVLLSEIYLLTEFPLKI